MENYDHKIYDAENEPVRGLLAGLTRVEAPSDFDFRVRARIAQGKPASPAIWLPASVRYAVPFVLVLAIGGYVAFNALNSPNVPAVAVTEQQNITPITAPPSSDGIITPNDDLRAERIEVRSPQSVNKGLVRNTGRTVPAPSTERRGGSYDIGGGVARKIEIIPATDILSRIGINASFAGSECKAQAVSAGTIAERSGVKSGDVIEAINDRAVTEKTAFGNKFTGKSLRVRRDGKSVKIDLVP